MAKSLEYSQPQKPQFLKYHGQCNCGNCGFCPISSLPTLACDSRSQEYTWETGETGYFPFIIFQKHTSTSTFALPFGLVVGQFCNWLNWGNWGNAFSGVYQHKWRNSPEKTFQEHPNLPIFSDVDEATKTHARPTRLGVFGRAFLGSSKHTRPVLGGVSYV